MDPPPSSGSLPLLGPRPSGREWMDQRQRDRDRSERSDRGRGWGASSSYNMFPNFYQHGSSSYYDSNRNPYGGGNNWRGGYGSRDRSRSRERIAPWGRDSRGEIPDQAIVVRSLPLDVSEVDLLKEVTKHRLHPRDVRLIRRESGASSGVAVVEFQSLQDSVRWMDVTQGVLQFQGRKARLTYSLPKEVITLGGYVPDKQDGRAAKEQAQASEQEGTPKEQASEQGTPKEGDTANEEIADGDWFCATCGVSNFKRRDMCFKCNFPREGPEALKQEDLPRVARLHSSSLLFRNLDLETTEDNILKVLEGMTTPAIKSLKVARDTRNNTSKGFCTVEFNSPAEATELHTLLVSLGEEFIIDGKQVTVSYARRPRTAMNRSQKSGNEDKAHEKLGGSSSDSYASDDCKTGSQDSKEEMPNRTIVVRGLMPSVSKADLRKQVLKHGLQPKDVRLLRKKATGASRGFAFVEFESLEEAAQWKELTQGAILFEGENRATLHYSVPMEVITLERNHASRQNWLCTTCGVSNFRQRVVCFQCNTPRLR